MAESAGTNKAGHGPAINVHTEKADQTARFYLLKNLLTQMSSLHVVGTVRIVDTIVVLSVVLYLVENLISSLYQLIIGTAG